MFLFSLPQVTEQTLVLFKKTVHCHTLFEHYTASTVSFPARHSVSQTQTLAWTDHALVLLQHDPPPGLPRALCPILLAGLRERGGVHMRARECLAGSHNNIRQ